MVSGSNPSPLFKGEVMRVLVSLFLVFALNAQAGNIMDRALFECIGYGMFFSNKNTQDDDIFGGCERVLQFATKTFIEQKELNYSLLLMMIDPKTISATKTEEKQVKQAIESALLRYFSTPAYPKKIKESKEKESVYIEVMLERYNDVSDIYHGTIKIVFGEMYPFKFKETYSLAFNRKSQFNYLTEYINDLIKKMADEIFEMANKDLSQFPDDTAKTKKPKESEIVRIPTPKDFIKD